MNGRLSVGIAGTGPRGLTVLERLCAGAAARPPAGPVIVHAVDPAPAGAGRVWQTDQSPQLLMNTVAEQITVFTDASVSCAGAVVPGPNLYQWATGLYQWATAAAIRPGVGSVTLAEAKADADARAVLGLESVRLFGAMEARAS
ncbi:FAD/NAD(P)-binding protein [Streptomyces sp. FIT100]|uniref:FAD/NAD(P)-binding protein n=1 Tax=Streptomyces sp. FIT100 TaxID=2837956 RepID=UPI0028BD6B7C|nr:FAD/NAD(P)-binding protein [Streptomyces sp. FIT100]